MEHYLGAIPSINRKEEPVEYHLRKEGSIRETIEANLPDEKYFVNVEFSNKLKLQPAEDLALDVLRIILSNRYRETIPGR
ncbi:MAG: hypothetical protein V8R91_00390 [Butyricimonas faecihominis]